MILHVYKLSLYFFLLFVDIFTRLFDNFVLIKFLIAVFLPASPFINFGSFCQPPRLLHPPHLFLILAKTCQPPRLFRPPLLFETREYSQTIKRNCVRTLQRKSKSSVISING